MNANGSSFSRNAWIALLFLFLAQASSASTPPQPPSAGGMILRVRLGDGSIQRIQVPPGSEETTTLSQILTPLSQNNELLTIQVGSSVITDDSQTLSTLGLKHGSLITITPPQQHSESRFAKTVSVSNNRFDPFPDLRRDYQTAIRQKARRRASQGGMSYGDLANVQSALHVVEPQPEGPLKRIYMCRISAERFQSNCIQKGKKGTLPLVTCRVGLLLGSIHRERVDSKPYKTRTSLSSTPSDQDFCQVVKVHALWEPPIQKTTAPTGTLDAKSLLLTERVLTVASWLGLTPVGWIFSYADSRSNDQEDSLPVWGLDVWNGARLEIANMERNGREQGAKFCTLAMDANTGATEAFQLSDVSVQMVAEHMWDNGNNNERFVTTQHEIFVDGKETTQLDTVLCLVNTAMLSHEGSFAGKAVNSIKKNGSLTGKTKNALLTAIEEDSSDHSTLLNALSDFNILMALDELLPPEDAHDLCQLVRKWVRGQKRGTQVGTKLKMVLQSVLNS